MSEVGKGTLEKTSSRESGEREPWREKTAVGAGNRTLERSSSCESGYRVPWKNIQMWQEKKGTLEKKQLWERGKGTLQKEKYKLFY
jgi:hypothetical protein